MAVTNQKTIDVNKAISLAGDSIWANESGPVNVSKIKYEFGFAWDDDGETPAAAPLALRVGVAPPPAAEELAV